MRGLLLALACLASACVDLGEESVYPAAFGEGGSGGADFEAVQAIFTPGCAFGGCHGGAAPAAGLSLEEGRSFEELLGTGGGGVDASHRDCRGLLLVAPGEPDESCLFILVDEGLMPPGGGLSPAQLETIRGWIAAGALPSGS